METKATRPAQIVFQGYENSHGQVVWTGRLLNTRDCIDTESGKPVSWAPYFDIVENLKTGKCTVTMQGGPDTGGRRYATHPNLDAAQKAGMAWASRRFRVPVKEPDPVHRGLMILLGSIGAVGQLR